MSPWLVCDEKCPIRGPRQVRRLAAADGVDSSDVAPTMRLQVETRTGLVVWRTWMRTVLLVLTAGWVGVVADGTRGRSGTRADP